MRRLLLSCNKRMCVDRAKPICVRSCSHHNGKEYKDTDWTTSPSATQSTAAFTSTNVLTAVRSSLGFIGLDNLGNTCYANSVLQSLFVTELFTERLLTLDMPYAAAKDHLLLNALRFLLGHLTLSVRGVFKPNAFAKTLP